MKTLMDTASLKPNIFDYTDYRAYLLAFYEWQRELGNFSHRTFAEKAGLKSRSYLRLVLTGKRNLTPESLPKFIKALDLKTSEAEAFTALVNYNQAQDFKTRKYYFDLFVAARPRTQRAHHVRDIYSFLSRKSYPILLTILNQKNVSHSTAALSQMCGLSASEIEEALVTFTHLGLIERHDDGTVKLIAKSFEVSDGVPNVATEAFHRNLLLMAQESLGTPVKDREFESVMIALSPSEFDYVRTRINDLAAEINERFSPPNPEREKVYSIHLNIIPVTPNFIRPKAATSQRLEDSQINKEEYSYEKL